MQYLSKYLEEVSGIAKMIDREAIMKIVAILKDLKGKGGRLFIIGVGGSAANASHAVNDFRKIDRIEAYSPADNVSELTARVNDDGWDSVFARYLEGSNLGSNDAVMVLSVGGGNAEKNISANIVRALDLAKEKGAKIIGIVSRDGGHTAKVADACVLVPVVSQENLTAHAESWQAVIWHAIAFHPELKIIEGKWESLEKPKNI